MSIGVNLIKRGLVFGYDVGIHRYYLGEPTTNLLNSSTNTIPTRGNGWGTYNTNQYNGAQYFSIGTISSVSNNIVTTSSAHPLRSFDVVTPQTTGGGLTAGTNYLIKKISSTTFSIHTYNSSQDGSQGYTNPSTGMFKVYDDYANDTRVSINSTSFPTMWWGPPHLPNSGLVKEVITNGFTNPLTGAVSDCLRQHVHRADGVADHMAYNVDAPFTPNVAVTCSFWGRAVDDNAVGKSINYYHYTYGQTSATAYSMSATLGAKGVWQRYSYTWTSPNSNAISYWFNPGGPYKYDIANIQVEHKSYATPYIHGGTSRSVTNTLKDIKRVKTLDISNVSYDSSGKIIFDGVNDTIDTGYALTSFPALSNFSFETIVKITSIPSAASPNGYNNTTKYGVLIGATYYCGAAIYWYSNGSSLYVYSFIRGNDAYRNTSVYSLSTNQYYHLVLVNDYTSSKLKLYVNGSLYNEVATATQEYNSSLSPSAGNIGISKPQVDGGGEGNYVYFPGEIPISRMYNVALSSSEIEQNYKAYKRRFNLP